MELRDVKGANLDSITSGATIRDRQPALAQDSGGDFCPYYGYVWAGFSANLDSTEAVYRITLTPMTPFKMGRLGLTVVVLLSCSCPRSLAQNATTSDSSQAGVVLTNLIQPVYPPLARQAHITGDVDLILGIRQDGLVDSVSVVSGHPLLKQAALVSVQQSQFECRKCTEALTTYRLAYTFKLEVVSECLPRDAKSSTKEEQHAYPQVKDAENRVTVVGYIICLIDPAPTPAKKARSVKCLYLWKCRS